MARRRAVFPGVDILRVAFAALLLLAIPQEVLPQFAMAQAADIPRTAEGRPDFQGVWENRWITPLERPDDTTAATVSGDEATAFAAARWADFFKDEGALHPQGDFDFAGLLPTGNGTFRTSLIVGPNNGKRPATQLSKDLGPIRSAISKAAENPEGLPNDARCMSANGRAPLGISPGSIYRQIVQTPEHVMIYTEDQMVSRVIGIGTAPRPDALVSLVGDSVSSWEGDTLMVVTDKIRTQLAPPGIPAFNQERRVAERFSLIAPDQISYDFVLEGNAMLRACP